jgi:hypothetical protein
MYCQAATIHLANSSLCSACWYLGFTNVFFKFEGSLLSTHISVPMIISGSGQTCCWDNFLGLKIKKKIKRAYQSSYQCEQCTNEKGYNFWLCHSTKKVDGIDIVVDCHTRYHVEKKSFSVQHTGGATESAVDSELTEE